jgi:hypothetical protein
VLLVVDHIRRETPLEEMADAVVAAIEALRVDPGQALHPLGQAPEPGFDDQVDVVVHQRAHVESPAEAADRLLHQLQERGAVEVVAEDPPPLDAAARDVVDPSRGKDVARSSRHRGHHSRPSGPSHLSFFDFSTIGTIPAQSRDR